VPEDLIEAAKVGELQPGTMKRVAVGGRAILLANVEGRFYAADDRCTHEEASLSAGVLKGERVKCPLHGSWFSVRTGEALEEPAEENLRTYRVRVVAERVLIDLSGAATP
jgi:3-phenylpropionate/trans-cinnamate dioxygenase ferredoxin component